MLLRSTTLDNISCCADHECKKLEHLFTRPAIANERLALNRAAQVALTLKTPYRDGTTHIVMSPLEFLQRLAALVPRPRLHLIRFHGVLAPNASCVPRSFHPQGAKQATALCLAFRACRTPSADPAEAPPPAAPARLSWARLLKRVFNIDIEHCPHCGGPLKIIAAIEHPPVIAKILTHSACPPGHRPDPWRGHSLSSPRPDRILIFPPIRFSP
jgi:hypothetical protein